MMPDRCVLKEKAASATQVPPVMETIHRMKHGLEEEQPEPLQRIERQHTFACTFSGSTFQAAVGARTPVRVSGLGSRLGTRESGVGTVTRRVTRSPGQCHWHSLTM